MHTCYTGYSFQHSIRERMQLHHVFEYGGTLDNRSFGGAQVSRTFYAKGQTGQQLLLGAYSASVSYTHLHIFLTVIIRKAASIRHPAQALVWLW